MEKFSHAGVVENVTCPSCGLLCDDLTIARDDAGNLSVKTNACQKSMAFYGRAPHNPSPRVGGKAVALNEAVTRAAEILRQANHALFSGLGTEVQGMRAIMSLADKACAVVDHMNSNGFIRNIHVVQNSGWQTTTLTEVRNRVDLLLVVATDVVSSYPRFFEREIWNKESMFGQDTSSREVVYLGGRNLDTSAGVAPNGRKPDVLPCDLERLPEVLAALRALVLGKKLIATEVGGIAMDDLRKLTDRLKAAKYSVVTWAASKLDFPHAELAIQNLTELIKTLNLTTRSSGLPLGGSNGDMDANQVSAWISGYPMRTSYARAYPEHDPYHFSTDNLLASGEADALFWISTLSPDQVPPATDLPTVVFGHPDMKLDQEPTVFIPAGVPGIDHKGITFRMDNVVSLPLVQLRASALPKLSDVLGAIEQAL